MFGRSQTNLDACSIVQPRYQEDADSGDLSHLPGDDDLLCPSIEINKRLFIDNEQPIVISIG